MYIYIYIYPRFCWNGKTCWLFRLLVLLVPDIPRRICKIHNVILYILTIDIWTLCLLVSIVIMVYICILRYFFFVPLVSRIYSFISFSARVILLLILSALLLRLWAYQSLEHPRSFTRASVAMSSGDLASQDEVYAKHVVGSRGRTCGLPGTLLVQHIGQ